MTINFRSPFVASIADLPRQEGAIKDFHAQIKAPEDFGIDLYRVEPGSDIDVDLTFQSVSEGVYVYGTVSAHATGECARCLRDLEEDMNEQVSELFYYPERLEAALASPDEDDSLEDAPVIEADHIDLEALIRDGLVIAMPLRPLCTPDCSGLCPTCGQRLDDLPADHHHEVKDSRFSALDELAAKLAAGESE